MPKNPARAGERGAQPHWAHLQHTMQPTYLGLPVLTVAQAMSRGLRAMTNPYYVPAEDWMLQNVVADMQRGKIVFALVQVGLGVEVWR